MGAFVTVFDARNLGWELWMPAVIGAVLALFGVALLVRRDVMMPSRSAGARLVIAILFLAGTVLWTGFAVYRITDSQREIEAALTANKVEKVIGRVTAYKPQFGEGSLPEAFCIDRAGLKPKCFSYSDYIPSAGFHSTAMHGGPVAAGAQLRVYYTGNLIIRLDVVPQAPQSPADGTE
jgi:hypothetical protein